MVTLFGRTKATHQAAGLLVPLIVVGMVWCLGRRAAIAGISPFVWLWSAALIPLLVERALILSGARARVTVGRTGCTQQNASEHRRKIDALHAFMQGGVIPFFAVCLVLQLFLKPGLRVLDSLVLTVPLTAGIVGLLWFVPKFRAYALRRAASFQHSVTLPWGGCR